MIDVSLNHQPYQVLRQYSCTMNASSLEWLLALTEPLTSVQEWAPVVLADMYSSSSGNAAVASDPGAVLASLFNSLIMQSGSAWNDTRSPIIIDDPTQGCLTPRAELSWPVVLLFTTVTVIFLGTAALWAFLTIMLRRFPSTVHQAEPPSDFLTWMRQAVVERNPSRDIKVRNLNRWSYARGPGGNLVLVCAPFGRRAHSVDEGDPATVRMLAFSPK